MNLVDVNVWVALAIGQHVHHVRARAWFDAIAEENSLLFCRATQQSFLRLLTTAAVYARYGLSPLSNEGAWARYEALVSDDRVAYRADEPHGIDERWRRFGAVTAPSPKLWMDAYLAAFALSGGARLVTTDASFTRFRGLRPLILA